MTPLTQDEYPNLFKEYEISIFRLRGMETSIKTVSKKIEIPIDLIMYMALLSGATATINAAPEYIEHFPNYFAYVTDSAKNTNKDPATDILAFWSFANIPRDTAAAIEKSAQYQQDFETHYAHALTFIVAHEVYHLLQTHTTTGAASSRTSQEQEFEADAYAVRILHKIGVPASPELPALYPYLNTSRHTDNTPPQKGSDISCRLYRIYETDMPRIEAAIANANGTPHPLFDPRLLKENMAVFKEQCLRQQ